MLLIGGHSGRATPELVPISEVKTASAVVAVDFNSQRPGRCQSLKILNLKTISKFTSKIID